MKKSLLFFYLIFYLILLSFVSWLRRVVDCVKLAVTAVVKVVRAALRRVIGPLHAVREIAIAATVGAFEVQGRKFLGIHEKVDHVAFRLQQGLYGVDPIEVVQFIVVQRQMDIFEGQPRRLGDVMAYVVDDCSSLDRQGLLLTCHGAKDHKNVGVLDGVGAIRK